MKEEKRGSSQEEKNAPSSKKLEIMHSFFFFISCSTNMFVLPMLIFSMIVYFNC
jgi:hypothetical protein